MKRNATKLMAAVVIAASAVASMTSCGKSDASHGDTDSIAALDTLVHRMDINLQELSAARSYHISIDTSVYNLTVTADVQWPEKIGDYSIKTFQDSIMSGCFGPGRDNIDKAIVNYVADISPLGITDENSIVKPVDKVFPTSPTNFTVDLNAKMLEFGKRVLVYQIVYQDFLGGAHPNTYSNILSYDLEQGKIVNGSDLIASDKINEFTMVVMKQLAAQLEMSPAQLRENLLSSNFSVSDDVYVADGFICVHYNPYEVLPYSFGTIDVRVSPYDVSQMLTPYARELLLD